MIFVIIILQLPIVSLCAMLSTVLDHRRVRQLITLVLIMCVLICMFPPEEPFFQQFAAYDVQIAASMVGLGLAFLISDKIRLMFVCFGCSAAICFFKNETTLRQELQKSMPTGCTIYNMASPKNSSDVSYNKNYELTETLA
ncbi:MAG: hypothetical protein WCR52_07595 [Bacteroidota bacterium]